MAPDRSSVRIRSTWRAPTAAMCVRSDGGLCGRSVLALKAVASEPSRRRSSHGASDVAGLPQAVASDRRRAGHGRWRRTALASGRMTKTRALSTANYGALLVHRYEEYVDPGWFPGQFNRGLFKSEAPASIRSTPTRPCASTPFSRTPSTSRRSCSRTRSGWGSVLWSSA